MATRKATKRTRKHSRRRPNEHQLQWLEQHTRMTTWERFMEAAMRQSDAPDFEAMLRTIGGGPIRQGQDEAARIERAARRADEALKQWERRWGDVAKGP